MLPIKRVFTCGILVLALTLSGCATTSGNHDDTDSDDRVLSEHNVTHFATGALIGIPIGFIVPLAILALAAS